MTKLVEIEKIDFGEDTFKIFIRPPKGRPMASSQVALLMKAMRTAKVLNLPDGTDIIVIKKDGNVQVF
jgi:hypothetical protein